MCKYSSLKYVCKNVPKMQEPVEILDTRGVNTKHVPYCRPINIRCPGTTQFAPVTRLAGFVHSGYYFYFFYQSYICGSCGSTPLNTANMYFQQNPISITDGFSEGSFFYCMLFRIIVTLYYFKVVLLTESFCH